MIWITRLEQFRECPNIEKEARQTVRHNKKTSKKFHSQDDRWIDIESPKYFAQKLANPPDPEKLEESEGSKAC